MIKYVFLLLDQRANRRPGSEREVKLQGFYAAAPPGQDAEAFAVRQRPHLSVSACRAVSVVEVLAEEPIVFSTSRSLLGPVRATIRTVRQIALKTHPGVEGTLKRCFEAIHKENEIINCCLVSERTWCARAAVPAVLHTSMNDYGDRLFNPTRPIRIST